MQAFLSGALRCVQAGMYLGLEFRQKAGSQRFDRTPSVEIDRRWAVVVGHTPRVAAGCTRQDTELQLHALNLNLPLER